MLTEPVWSQGIALIGPGSKGRDGVSRLDGSWVLSIAYATDSRDSLARKPADFRLTSLKQYRKFWGSGVFGLCGDVITSNGSRSLGASRFEDAVPSLNHQMALGHHPGHTSRPPQPFAVWPWDLDAFEKNLNKSS